MNALPAIHCGQCGDTGELPREAGGEACGSCPRCAVCGVECSRHPESERRECALVLSYSERPAREYLSRWDDPRQHRAATWDGWERVKEIEQ